MKPMTAPDGVKLETASKARSNPARDFNGSSPENSRVLSRVNKSFRRAHEAGKMAALVGLGLATAEDLANVFRDSGDGFSNSGKKDGNRHIFWSEGNATGPQSVGDRVSPGFTEGNKSVTNYGGV